MSRLFVSAAHKSSGKTTVCIGLCAALRARGETVQPFKKGPDYIDPLWLGMAAGRPCYNLDAYLMGADEIRAQVAQRMQGATLGIIEGNKGLYDGLDLDGSNSNAAMAALTGTPVVLVIDARGMTRGIAPLILGYQAFDRNIRIAGVILNQLGGSRHEAKLRAVIQHYTGVPVLGAVQHDERIAIVERHLGLVPSNEAQGARSRIDEIAAHIAAQVDLDQLLAIARQSAPLTRGEPLRHAAGGPRVRIGIARDAAFGFYYPGDLDALRAAGAELVSFDALHAEHLPNVDGVFIGGGFPETHMEALAANTSLRRELREAIEAGLPAYAECGGLMYLARGIEWNGRAAEMVGVIPADIVMHSRPVGRGYVHLRETGRSPWPQSSVRDSQPIRAHEFHYSSVEKLAPGVEFAYEVERGHGIDGRHDGIVHRNLLASYAHLRDVAGNPWARRFVDFVRNCGHAA
ncbi:MAG: cobyrinic acid a,c-diamide synthase [Betaproteobacteria bacterium RIFCSPLOWO2_12_FULL_65_14]|nr:MAG: cobyrinic acid a,c-diamide synthase [Betaproteobacteria bacterium RIFCSPLOWO2_12_FULL_65_14]